MRTSSSIVGPAGRVPVAVLAADPITLAGVTSQLRQQPAIELVDTPQRQEGLVAVLLAETVDDPTLARLRRLVRAECARAVLVTSTVRDADLLKVIDCGVRVIVRRGEATAHRLLEAILAAAGDDGVLPADLLGRLMKQVCALRSSDTDQSALHCAGLSPREVDVLRLVAEGMETAEIAVELSYSERTVKNVMHGLTTRLQLRNRAHAVAYACREGYI